MRLLQEAQGTSLSVHAALCTEKTQEVVQGTPTLTRALSTGATPQLSTPRTPIGSPPRSSRAVENQRTPLNIAVLMMMEAAMRTYYYWHNCKGDYL